eukprot:NODE_7854_length_253_cov_163.598039_g7239_i0.p1 GENE.NODE_7854_length_253_cov_163.598039_g7239_i0~~NODE_7854_length_253_cov_163.598039_g7239_i0.p1  ORF type:complete len:53 (-),score=22.80 NODE_7854_length_253_cov_163.598039_g7239_i0:94-222(-)
MGCLAEVPEERKKPPPSRSPHRSAPVADDAFALANTWRRVPH